MTNFNSTSTFLPINLSFFSGEKTEQPTAKKRSKAREEGQVAKSQEISTAFMLIFVFFGLRMLAPSMLNNIQSVLLYNFAIMADIENTFNTDFLISYGTYMFGQAILIVIPIFAFSVSVGIITNLLQVGWKPTTKPLKPKLSKLNPIAGLKRLFSIQKLVDLVKALVKFAAIIAAVYFMIVGEIEMIPTMLDMELIVAISYVANLAATLGVNIGVMFLFIALADIFYVRYSHTKKLKMSKQEVKDEYKTSEGDPKIKAQIRRRMQEASMRRMMGNVPNADVIITNPTHYAVAVRYDKEKGEAPFVVAKGVDFMAKRIREKAKESNVEIVENVHLARTLYATVEVGQPIPPELYQAVAEILAFVYKLKSS